MSMESDLAALLSAICPQSYPDVAPAGTVPPYITWQSLGGEALRYGDNSAPDKRNALLQVSVWSKTRLEALTIIHQVEDALCASSTLTTKPLGEPSSVSEQDTGLRGSIQRFDIWADR